MRRTDTVVALVALVGLGGCATAPAKTGSVDRHRLERRAFECLKAAVRYEHNPAVRCAAVEALESSTRDEAKPWIRLALHDDHPAVRFAACAAIGRLRDTVAEPAVRACLEDGDHSVRVAALFALHRLGDMTRTGRIAGYLLDDKEPTVRRNAALLLGLLGEAGAVKVLAKAMKDTDPGVRHHALEAMARLGNEEARQELSFMANAGVGSEEVFALNALAATRNPLCQDMFLYKLGSAAHLETKLAAARGLGRLGSDDGFNVALAALHVNRARTGDPDDPPEARVLRVKQLAAAALGTIKKVDALPALKNMLDGEPDPRVQVSAARAILEILGANREVALPFPSPNAGR